MRNDLLLTGACTLLGICLTGLVHAQQASSTDPPTLDQIAQGIRVAERLIFSDSKSFEIVYALETSQDITPTEISGGLFLMEWHVAWREPDEWYSQAAYRQEKSKIGISLPQEPMISLIRKGMVFDWFGERRHCTIDPANKSINYFKGWDYLQYLGFDPFRQISKSAWPNSQALIKRLQGNPLLKEMQEPFLPDSLEKNRAHYLVDPQPDRVDGFRCWVVEWPGMHKFWVDVDHGFAIRRRIVHWGPGEPRKREVLSSDFRQVKPGLWLPYKMVVDQYAKIAVEPKPLWGRIANRSTFTVKKIEFDQNLDDLYAVKLPAGMIVHDFVRQIEFRIPKDGVDPFEEPIRQSSD